MTTPIDKIKEHLRIWQGVDKRATPAPWSIHVGFDRFSANPGCYGAYLEFGSDYNSLVSSWSAGENTPRTRK